MLLLQLPGPRTRLYPLIQQRVAEEAQPLFDRLQAWRMMSSGSGLATTDIHGKPVRYSGVKFQKTPRVVFWGGFFEPFISKAAQQSFQWTIDSCRERNLDATEYLAETRDLLGVLVEGVYGYMAKTDQLLRGEGFPDSISPTNVSPKIEAMKRSLDDLLVALTHSGPLPTSSSPPADKKEILLLKPSIWGMGIDLKMLWYRWFRGR
jgi:hypothetical protein